MLILISSPLEQFDLFILTSILGMIHNDVAISFAVSSLIIRDLPDDLPDDLLDDLLDDLPDYLPDAFPYALECLQFLVESSGHMSDYAVDKIGFETELDNIEPEVDSSALAYFVEYTYLSLILILVFF